MASIDIHGLHGSGSLLDITILTWFPWLATWNSRETEHISFGSVCLPFVEHAHAPFLHGSIVQ